MEVIQEKVPFKLFIGAVSQAVPVICRGIEMLYFIPAWYQQNKWCENEQVWYVRRMHTEFDDSVKQIQLFHRNEVYPYQIILLGFTPNFRHFLHRQGVYHASYWSCFDAIQEIRRKKAMVLSFHDLNWPPSVEFIYSPFVVVAFQEGEKYAQIEFGEDGNPVQIDLYKNGKICRRNIYDDRGFVSSTIIYREEKPLYQDYLLENGEWKLRFFQQDGHVEVNPKHCDYLLLYRDMEQIRQFSRLSYESMDQIIYEVLVSYLTLTEDTDIFCVAMHRLHTTLLKEALKNRKTVLSFYTDRYSIADDIENTDIIKRASCIIADSRDTMKSVQMETGNTVKNIAVITPYDSRADFGISQQLKVQKILVPVDGLDEICFGELIRLLGGYLTRNEDARIHLFTRQADWDKKRRLLEQTRKELRRFGLEEGWAEEEEKSIPAENLEIEESIPIKFFVEQCVDELAVSKCMREQRVLVDMRNIPELYLQIAAISIGIPQIVHAWTEFVEDGGNGLILREIEKLPEALDYYLSGLKNWNEAMVCSYEIGKEYTTEKLMETWRGVIDFVGQNSYITAGGDRLE